MMRLEFLPANQAWAFTYGESSVIAMGDHGTIFNDRAEAVHAADCQGLAVEWNGEVRAV